jgi:hypothetical protein
MSVAMIAIQVADFCGGQRRSLHGERESDRQGEEQCSLRDGVNGIKVLGNARVHDRYSHGWGCPKR